MHRSSGISYREIYDAFGKSANNRVGVARENGSENLNFLALYADLTYSLRSLAKYVEYVKNAISLLRITCVICRTVRITLFFPPCEYNYYVLASFSLFFFFYDNKVDH